MTMKRRVVYMDDATWEALRELAASQATSISEHLRRAVTGDGKLVDSLALAQAGERAAASARADKAAHDRLVEDSDETPAFLRRTLATRITGHDAFAELRPAPKPRRKA